MNVPNKEEAVRFFTDVKLAVETFPESFTSPGLISTFADQMLESLSGEWKTLERLPDPYYEINVDGVIRHKVTREIIEPTYQIQYGQHLVKLRMDGQTYYFDGPRVASEMFKSVVM